MSLHSMHPQPCCCMSRCSQPGHAPFAQLCSTVTTSDGLFAFLGSCPPLLNVRGLVASHSASQLCRLLLPVSLGLLFRQHPSFPPLAVHDQLQQALAWACSTPSLALGICPYNQASSMQLATPEQLHLCYHCQQIW